MKLIIHWLLSTVAVIVASYLLPGIEVPNFAVAFIVAVVLAALYFFVKPIITILTLPINILTLGLFTLVINAILIMLTEAIVPGFVVSSFWSALLFGIVFTIVNTILHTVSKK